MFKKYWKRLVWANPEDRQNFLIYPFLLMTISYGVGMVFFAGAESVQQSILFKLTLTTFGAMTASVWGIIALIVGVGAIVGIMARKKWLGTSVTWTGFLLWTYALMLYIINGYILQIFFAAIPNMLFWGWWWMRVQDFHNNKEQIPN